MLVRSRPAPKKTMSVSENGTPKLMRPPVCLTVKLPMFSAGGRVVRRYTSNERVMPSSVKYGLVCDSAMVRL